MTHVWLKYILFRWARTDSNQRRSYKSFSLSLSLFLSFFIPSFPLSLSLTHTYTRSLCLSLTYYTLTLSSSMGIPISLSHDQSPTLALSQTHTHTHFCTGWLMGPRRKFYSGAHFATSARMVHGIEDERTNEGSEKRHLRRKNVM